MKARPWLLLPLIGLLGCDRDSCGNGDGGGFGPPAEVLVESGAYTAQDPVALDSPHAGGRDFSLDVNRAAGLVTVRYERDGQIVEEIWQITSQEVSNPFLLERRPIEPSDPLASRVPGRRAIAA